MLENRNKLENRELHKWMGWFTGFVAAEGNFQVYPKKRVLKSGEISKYNVGLGFHLSLHSRDIDIIRTVHQTLNKLGTIYSYKDKPDVRLAINDRSGLKTLMERLEDYSLVIEHQISRHMLLKRFLMEDIKEFKTLEEFNECKERILLDVQGTINKNYLLGFTEESSRQHWKLILDSGELDSWLVGFINGEGCFYLNKDKCNFFIEHTSEFALELLKYRLSFGPKVSKRAPRGRDLGKTHLKATYKLIVSSKSDINSLISFLDNTAVSLLGFKLAQYNEWKDKWKD